MKTTTRTFLVALVAFTTVPPASIRAQEAAAPTEDTDGRDGALRVFVDCPRWLCDDDFLRTEIQFVNYVRDRHDAELHILVTSQPTGGGGRAFTLNFIGQDRFDGKADTLSYVTPQSATSDDRRRGIAHTIKLGLVRYVAESPLADAIRVAFEAPEGGAGDAATVQGTPENDSWNYWVFGIGLDGSMEGASSEREVDLGARLSADRTTATWKMEFDARFGYDDERIELEDQTIENIEHTYYVGGSIVRSLGRNISSGLRASIRRPPTYENRERAVRIAPAIQYNFFPYEEWNRRRVVLTYSVGTSDVRYLEETVYFKMRETIYDHRMALSYDARQPWGSAGIRLSGSHYLSYTDRYSVDLGGHVSIQLTRGLSLNFGGGVERVNDQIGLPVGDADPQDVLLQRRQLATEYEYGFGIGFDYRFGSIFNNIVNPRFDDWY